MKPPRCSQHDLDTAQELASLFAIDALPPSEARSFGLHVESCDFCAAEVESHRSALAVLARGVGDVNARPRASLRDELLESVSGDTADELKLEPSRLLVSRASESEWMPLGVPGVTCRMLSSDRQSRRQTMLLRMEPGRRFPPHRHADVEEVYVLEGDLRSETLVLEAGDYTRADGETDHEELWTESGCVCLVMSSMDNRFL